MTKSTNKKTKIVDTEIEPGLIFARRKPLGFWAIVKEIWWRMIALL